MELLYVDNQNGETSHQQVVTNILSPIAANIQHPYRHCRLIASTLKCWCLLFMEKLSILWQYLIDDEILWYVGDKLFCAKIVGNKNATSTLEAKISDMQKITMLLTFLIWIIGNQHLESVTKISKLSLTETVTNIHHQHW